MNGYKTYALSVLWALAGLALVLFTDMQALGWSLIAHSSFASTIRHAIANAAKP